MYILKPYILIIYFFFYFYFDYNSTIKNVHNFVFTLNIKKIKYHVEYFMQTVTVTVTIVLMVIFTMF